MKISQSFLLNCFENLLQYSNSEGFLHDKKYRHQYHLAAIVLCIAHKTGNKKILAQDQTIFVNCLEAIEKSFKEKGGSINADFSFESLCLAHFYSKNSYLKETLSAFILSNQNILKSEINAHAVDYYLLRNFNINYINKEFTSNLTIPESVKLVIERLHESSGILFDTLNKTSGVPDLTYHCRNLQILANSLRINNEIALLPLLKKAVSFTKNISGVEGRICYYGRTPDLIYGHAALLNALASLFGDKSLTDWVSSMEYFERSFISSDGLLLRVSSESDECELSRQGYDSYVYPMVYKWFALSKLFCVLSERQSKYDGCLDQQNKRSKTFFDSKSGFFTYKGKSHQVSFNLLGHPDAQIRKLDSRYLPLIPSYHSKQNFLSTVPFATDIKFQNEGLIKKIIRRYSDWKIKFLYTKRNVGFTPIFYRPFMYLVPAKFEILKCSENDIFLNTSKFYKGTIFGEKLVNASDIQFRLSLNVNYAEGLKMKFCTNQKSRLQFNVLNKSKKYSFIDKDIICCDSEKIMSVSDELAMNSRRPRKLRTALGSAYLFEMFSTKKLNEFIIEFKD